MADEKNILSNNEELNDEQLINYLKGILSAEAMQAIEQKIADDAFTKDAIEGLQQLSDKKLDDYVKQLNWQLHQQTSAPKLRKEKRRLKDQHWIVQAAVIILLLCMLAYVLVTFIRKH